MELISAKRTRSGRLVKTPNFGEKRSTQHALIDIVNKIHYMDKKLFSCGIFIDLNKAFDVKKSNFIIFRPY